MGALATKTQVERVRENVEILMKSQSIVYGNMDDFEVLGADKDKGAFFSPILFRNDEPFKNTDVHKIEFLSLTSTFTCSLMIIYIFFFQPNFPSLKKNVKRKRKRNSIL